MYVPGREHLKREYNVTLPSDSELILRRSVRLEEHTLVASNCILMVREIGSFTYIGRKCELYSTNLIGRYCSFGQEILMGAGPHPTDWLSTSSFFYRKGMFGGARLTEEFYVAQAADFVGVTKPVVVGNDVWIGSRAIIMAGVEIGHGAVIAAGAIVTKDVEPYAIVAGVPAKIIRKRFDDTVVERLLASEWWRVKPDLLKGLDYSDVELMLDHIEHVRAAEADWEYRPQKVVVSAA